MRLLTSVLKDPQIQNYISEQEDSAFEYLKSNFSVNDIYEHIVNNISFYINEDDIEGSYENIKTAASSYTIRVLNEAEIAGFGSFQERLFRLGFSKDEAEQLADGAEKIRFSGFFNKSGEVNKYMAAVESGDYKSAIKVINDNGLYNDYTNTYDTSAASALANLDKSTLLDRAGRFFLKLGRTDLTDIVNNTKQFIMQYPQYAIPATLLAIIGCVGIAFGIKKMKK